MASEYLVSPAARPSSSLAASAASQTQCAGPFGFDQTVADGLNPNTNYLYTAYRDAQCTDAVAAAASATTQQQVQPPQGSPPPPVAKVWTHRSCDDLFYPFRLGWERAPSATGYDLNYSYNGGRRWIRVLNNDNRNRWNVYGSPTNRTAWFAVRARNAHGASAWTNFPVSRMPPCKPASLQASWTNAGIYVTWSAGQRATGYDLNYTTDGGKSWTRAVSNHGSTSYTLADANGIKSYIFAVRSLRGCL